MYKPYKVRNIFELQRDDRLQNYFPAFLAEVTRDPNLSLWPLKYRRHRLSYIDKYRRDSGKINPKRHHFSNTNTGADPQIN